MTKRGPTLTIDDVSEPGAWAKALRTPCSYRTISEHPGAHTRNPTPGNSGAAVLNPDAAPPLSNSVHSPQIL